MTRFTTDIFAALIGVIFIYEGIAELVSLVNHGGESAALPILLTLGTVLIAISLDKAKDWTLISRQFCNFVADYAMSLTVGDN